MRYLLLSNLTESKRRTIASFIGGGPHTQIFEKAFLISFWAKTSKV